MIINQNVERLSKSRAEIKWEKQGLDFPRKKDEKKKKSRERSINRNSRSVSPNLKNSFRKNQNNHNADLRDQNNENIKFVHFSK